MCTNLSNIFELKYYYVGIVLMPTVGLIRTCVLFINWQELLLIRHYQEGTFSLKYSTDANNNNFVE